MPEVTQAHTQDSISDLNLATASCFTPRAQLGSLETTPPPPYAEAVFEIFQMRLALTPCSDPFKCPRPREEASSPGPAETWPLGPLPVTSWGMAACRLPVFILFPPLLVFSTLLFFGHFWFSSPSPPCKTKLHFIVTILNPCLDRKTLPFLFSI